MENEIIEVPEIVDADEVIVATEGSEESGNGLLIAAIVGATVLTGVFVWKKVIKPLIAKVKAKKEAELEAKSIAEYELVGDDEIESENDSSEE